MVESSLQERSRLVHPNALTPQICFERGALRETPLRRHGRAPQPVGELIDQKLNLAHIHYVPHNGFLETHVAERVL